MLIALVSAKLISFGGINSPQANARRVNFERIAVDDAGLPGKQQGSDRLSRSHRTIRYFLAAFLRWLSAAAMSLHHGLALPAIRLTEHG